MHTSAWHDFLTALVGFAGTLFAVIVAIRPLTSHRLGRQHRAAGDRLEAGSVTFELAVAAVCALAYLAPNHAVRTFFVAIATLTGMSLVGARVIVHLQEYGRWRRTSTEPLDANRPQFKAIDHWRIAGHAFPLACYAILAASQVLPLRPTATALAMVWLVLSGTAQAILWFLNTWKESVNESPSAANL